MKSALSPKSFGSYLISGGQAAVGWGAVNGLGRLEMRLGFGRVLDKIPGGVLQKVVGYAVKIFNVGLVNGLSGMFKLSPRFRNNLVIGGVANLGVNVVSDLAGAFGAQGEQARSLLKGIGDVSGDGLGDYVLASNPYATWSSPHGLSDYRGIDGRMSMGDRVGQDVYGGSAGPYD